MGSEGYAADISDESSVEAIFDRTGDFDHLIFTAGEIVWQRSIEETDLPDAKDFFGLRYWPGGSIVLTSSKLPLKQVTSSTDNWLCNWRKHLLSCRGLRSGACRRTSVGAR